MPFLVVDKSGTEKVFEYSPDKNIQFGQYIGSFPNGSVRLPHGTIRKLIGRDLFWQDEPVELTEEMVKEPEKPDYYAGIEWVNDWAEFRAIDKDGEMFEFREKPIPDEKDKIFTDPCFLPIQSSCLIYSLNREIPDWQSTLQERITK